MVYKKKQNKITNNQTILELTYFYCCSKKQKQNITVFIIIKNNLFKTLIPKKNKYCI